MQVSVESMDFQDAERRGDSPWMMTTNDNAIYDSQNTYSTSNLTSGPPPSRPLTTDNTMIPPVDPLGIRCWPSAMRPVSRPQLSRPTTIHEAPVSTYSPNGQRPTSWNAYDPRMPQYQMAPPSAGTPTGLSPFNSIDGSMMDQKPAEESLDFANLDADLSQFHQDLAQQDENAPIIHLRKPSLNDQEPLSLDTSFPRRLSSSTFSLSSNAPTDLPDLSAYSEVPSYTSDYTPRSSLNLSATPLSPVPSPRYSNPDPGRTGSRSKASPSPRPSMRTAPYSLDSNRNKRWSTGSYTSGGSYSSASPARRTSPLIYTPDGLYPQVTNANILRHSTPIIPSPNPTSTPTTTTPTIPPPPPPPPPPPMNPFLPSANLMKTPVVGSQPPPRFHRNSVLLPSSIFDSNPPPLPLPSHKPPHLFRTLQSNASPHDHHLAHYAEDLSDPPDLFGPLSSPPQSPPPSDMTPSSPTLTPHEQDLRFPGDLYTPRYVRGHGNKREGWCGICKPGRWLVLKNSAFWYDKSFTHGISAATGQAFESPQDTRRMEGNADVWEGLCAKCGEWVALVSSKKKGTTWFRHAYKCHTHQKVKDVPKRRRESSHVRPSTASSIMMGNTGPTSGSSSNGNLKTEPVTPALSTTSITDPGSTGPPSTNTNGAIKTSPLHSLASMI